ncbi:MAG TPA: GNAT family N-acetyltransferase [Streptosporangiaceae bacterium]
MIRIRPAEAADAHAMAQVRAQSWRTAYAGVIPDQTLADLTAPEMVRREAQWRAEHSMDGFLIAEAEPCAAAEAAPAVAGEAAAPEAGTQAAEIIGFASFGPERGEDDRPGQPVPGPSDLDRAELYALCVLPRHWSSGAGRALVDRALALAAQAGYADISLWVLEGNERGRRFYEQAGFAGTGESAALTRLGGVSGVRYRRLVG